MEQETIKNINQFIEKVNQSKKQEQMDLSSDEDLSLAVMNLVSIEEHFFFTGAKTGKSEYYELLREAREIRKQLLKKLIGDDREGEIWCLEKHLLAASMRLMEVGTKQLSAGKKEEAYDLFQKAYELYSLFWGLNLKVIKADAVEKIDNNAINKHDKEKKGFLGKLGELVKKAIDCCKE